MKSIGLPMCSASMLAILAGRKFQTRRIIKGLLGEVESIHPWSGTSPNDWREWKVTYQDAPAEIIKPPAVPGEELWFREEWRIGAWHEDTGEVAIDYRADGFCRQEWIFVEDEERFERYWIQSSDDAMKAGTEMDADGQYHWKPGDAPTRWRRAIFMPRAFCRLFRTLADIRAERVQDISDIDIEEEGIEPVEDASGFGDDLYLTRLEFGKWWDELHGEGAWERNDFCWVYTWREPDGD